MTEELTERQHYNALVKKVGGLEAIEGIGKGFTNEDVVERNRSRVIAKNVYSKDNGVPVTSIEHISNGELEGHLASKLEKKRVDLHEYIADHKDEIVEGIPKTRLEKAVIDYLPRLGINPLPKAGGMLGELSKMHEAYLATRETFEKYVRGEPIAEESRLELRGVAAQALRSEEHKRLIEEGYDPENKDHADLFMLSENAAGEKAYRADRETVAKYAGKALDTLRSDLKKTIEENYGVEEYSRELVRASIGNDDMGTARALSVLDRTKFS